MWGGGGGHFKCAHSSLGHCVNPGLLQVSDKSTISEEQLGYILLSMSWHTEDVMVLEALSLIL